MTQRGPAATKEAPWFELVALATTWALGNTPHTLAAYCLAGDSRTMSFCTDSPEP